MAYKETTEFYIFQQSFRKSSVYWVNKRGKGIHTRDADEIPLLVCLFCWTTMFLSKNNRFHTSILGFLQKLKWHSYTGNFQDATFALTQFSLCKKNGTNFLRWYIIWYYTWNEFKLPRGTLIIPKKYSDNTIENIRWYLEGAQMILKKYTDGTQKVLKKYSDESQEVHRWYSEAT